MLFILQLFTGIFWTLTYILIIFKSSKDKTYGMPVTALCANISWEFVFSFIFPHAGLQRIINITWFIFDLIIILQYFKYGKKAFAKHLPIRYFYPAFLLTLILSFSIIVTVTVDFSDYDGRYTAFSQNLMMSILFVGMIIRRKNTKGQSLAIAVCKMTGSLFAAIAFHLFFKSGFISLVSLATLIYDLIYVFMIYNKSKGQSL